MKVSPETAKRVLGWLKMHNGHFGQAAHDCEVSITSLGHYTCAALERQRNVLRWLDNLNITKPETTPERLAALERIANEQP